MQIAIGQQKVEEESPLPFVPHFLLLNKMPLLIPQ